MSGSASPVHLLAGGNWRNRKGPDPLLEPVLAGTGAEIPSIACIGAANEDDPGFFRWVKAYLRRAGAGEVRLVSLASPQADLVEARVTLAGCDVVFLSGGDVEVGMRHLQERGIIPHLEQLHRAGKPFFGLSAGSIMLARCWVRWVDPLDDATKEVFACLGLAPVLCDTHAESDEWEELAALLQLIEGPAIGYGIPSDSALRVNADGSVAALGRPVHRLRLRGGEVARLQDLAPL